MHNPIFVPGSIILPGTGLTRSPTSTNQLQLVKMKRSSLSLPENQPAPEIGVNTVISNPHEYSNDVISKAKFYFYEITDFH